MKEGSTEAARASSILFFGLGSRQEQLEDFPHRDGFALVPQGEAPEGLGVGVSVHHDALLHRQHAGDPLALFRERGVHVLLLGLGVENGDQLGGGNLAFHRVSVQHAVVAVEGWQERERFDTDMKKAQTVDAYQIVQLKKRKCNQALDSPLVFTRPSIFYNSLSLITPP